MTHAINPAEASPSPADPSEYTCGHCPNTMTQREVRGMCCGEEDKPAYLICDNCLRSLNEERIKEEKEQEDLEEFEMDTDPCSYMRDK